MASLQHVYRRGHIFWWRRAHPISGRRPLDIRISLKTFDRCEARNRGAALTASSGGVLDMLNGKVAGGREPTEQELQDIAKAMYGEQLARLCSDQRSVPWMADFQSQANRAYVDYFQRLQKHGGRLSLLPSEEDGLIANGWSEDRVADLKRVIALSDDGHSPIKPEAIDLHLRRHDFEPDDKLRWLVELALYPAYRDAFRDADAALHGGQSIAASTLTTPTVAPAAMGENPIPEEWRYATPTAVAERLIAETPKMFEHRRGGKRAVEQVGEQTLRQIRWAATLLEKSLPSGTPMWKVTRKDIKELDRFFDQLPVTFGKAPKDREPATTLVQAAAEAADRVEAGELEPEAIGLKTGTTNKHFNKLGQVHKFMRSHIADIAPIDFGEFTTPIVENEMEARMRYTYDQGKAIFSLPPWTGCADADNRLSPGRQIIHDGLFFVLLLVWYTGARREELCKLLIDDVESKHGYHFLAIRPTSTGRLKNKSARRVVVIADELIRLGFLRYVDSLRAAGETLLFPELMPATGTKRKLGDVFYKNWWIYLKPHVPGLQRGQAMHAARHMVSDEMKDQEVFIEYRNDYMGWKGQGGEGMTRYPSRSSLQRLQQVGNRIPVVTDHLPDQTKIQLLPAPMRKPRPSRKSASD